MNQEHIREIKAALLVGYGMTIDPEITEIKTPLGLGTGLYNVNIKGKFFGVWDSRRKTFGD